MAAKTTTDAEGKFRFTAVAAGEYHIRAEHAGFTAFTRDLHVPGGTGTLQLPLVITRPQDARPAASAPAGAGGRGGGNGAGPTATATIPADQIAALPLVTRNALNFLTFLPGVDMAGTHSQRDSTVMGLPQAAISISIDGVNIQDQLWRGAPGTETYAPIDPNRFQPTRERPLSTFGADVDTASYSNVRRFLSSGQLPPHDAVRVEELVNYFHFAYAEPRDGRPIALTTEVGECPWAPSHKLVLIGARAKAPSARDVEGRNIVLLIDVSGSMAPQERLPLIKTALGMFVDTLHPDDTLSIVTYAGTSGVALYPTPARQRDVIQRAIANLYAGGSTNGGAGLQMAYRIAREAFIPGGVNRVILATDGDFNVGIVSLNDLQRLIERERDSGVFLSVFGVGTDNLKDQTMEMLADKGNGNYAYLDSLQEARRVLIREGDATLDTVAKDVKFQVEFNPAAVSAWKLIGHEDRALAARDFNNDRKDGGEMGAGHTVTVLYEVVPVGVGYGDNEGAINRPAVDPLKYQPPPPAMRPEPGAPMHADEWLTVKARYKMPEGETSDLVTQVARPGGRVQFLPLASAVAEFGLLLRDAPRNVQRWDALARRVDALSVPASQSADKDGFKELVAIAQGLARLR